MKLSSRSKNAQRSLELSTPGFIDIVFLLLIFFLVTSTFLRPERQMSSNIAAREEKAENRTNDLEPAVVELIMRGQRPVFKVGMFTTDNEDELIEFLSNYVNKQDGAFVRAHPEIPFEMTAQALGACRISGFNPVTMVPGEK